MTRWYGTPRVSWQDAEDHCRYAAPFDCAKWDFDCSPNLVWITSPDENEFVLDFWKTSREQILDPFEGQVCFIEPFYVIR